MCGARKGFLSFSIFPANQSTSSKIMSCQDEVVKIGKKLEKLISSKSTVSRCNSVILLLPIGQAGDPYSRLPWRGFIVMHKCFCSA